MNINRQRLRNSLQDDLVNPAIEGGNRSEDAGNSGHGAVRSEGHHPEEVAIERDRTTLVARTGALGGRVGAEHVLIERIAILQVAVIEVGQLDGAAHQNIRHRAAHCRAAKPTDHQGGRISRHDLHQVHNADRATQREGAVQLQHGNVEVSGHAVEVGMLDESSAIQDGAPGGEIHAARPHCDLGRRAATVITLSDY